uniref:Uncharacterized protein n=1 Tax=Oryza sativa subsp. japonica TaxID=39947 RepID=Q6ETQ6_ORYSJ|nr:hypothetical protein [Oryza sativa Japonica Group]
MHWSYIYAMQAASMHADREPGDLGDGDGGATARDNSGALPSTRSGRRAALPFARSDGRGGGGLPKPSASSPLSSSLMAALSLSCLCHCCPRSPFPV